MQTLFKKKQFWLYQYQIQQILEQWKFLQRETLNNDKRINPPVQYNNPKGVYAKQMSIKIQEKLRVESRNRQIHNYSWDSNSLLSETFRTSRKQISKNIQGSQPHEQQDPSDIDRMFHPTTEESTIFSSMHGIHKDTPYPKISAYLKQFKSQNMISDQKNGILLERKTISLLQIICKHLLFWCKSLQKYCKRNLLDIM